MQGPTLFPRTMSYELAEDCQGPGVWLSCPAQRIDGKTERKMWQGKQLSVAAKENTPRATLKESTFNSLAKLSLVLSWEGLVRLGDSEKGVAVWSYSLRDIPRGE